MKRINRVDKAKRIIGEQQITRFFASENNYNTVNAWLASLDITRIRGNSQKKLFDTLVNRLLVPTISDETNMYKERGLKEQLRDKKSRI